MTNSFFDVLGQVMVLFILTAIGYICGKTGITDSKSEACLAAITLYISTPCVIISSFQVSFKPELWHGFLITLLVSSGIYLLGIVVAHLTIKDKTQGRRNVLRFAAVFSNCGFMGLPLAQSIYGDEGVFYCAAVVAVFNLLIWTYGYFLMGSGSGALPVKKLLLNPGILALLVGTLMFFLSIKLPSPIFSALKHAANLNTPLGMLVVGSRLSAGNMRSIFEKGSAWLCAAERLLLIPLLAITLLYFLGIRGVAAVVCVIAGCAPAASTTTMFAVLFRHDERLAANTVSSQTLLSALTMPPVIWLAQTLLS